MDMMFYISSAVAIVATLLAITRLNAVHALLYLIVSLLAVAVIFYALGAHFVAALEVIIYAGAIMVLFVFVIMMLNLGPQAVSQEREWLRPHVWLGPAALGLVLFIELVYVLFSGAAAGAGVGAAVSGQVEPAQVGAALFGPYVIALELASMLLLSGLVGAYHLGRRARRPDAGRPT